MKKLLIPTYLLFAIVLLASCRKDLERINKNPNEPVTVQPDYLLSNGIKANVDTYWGPDAAMDGTLLYVQYWSKIQYTDADRYIAGATGTQNVWSNFMHRVLKTLPRWHSWAIVCITPIIKPWP